MPTTPPESVPGATLPEGPPDLLAPRAGELDVLTWPVPCVARPSTGFVHRDGVCRCFVGGPAPEFTTPPRATHRRPFAP